MGFKQAEVSPEFEVPIKRQYEFMIHTLMKEYGLNRKEAEEMTEYDYCLLIGFENLNAEKEKNNV